MSSPKRYRGIGADDRVDDLPAAREARRRAQRRPAPPAFAETLVDVDANTNQGTIAATPGNLSRLLGRPTTQLARDDPDGARQTRARRQVELDEVDPISGAARHACRSAPSRGVSSSTGSRSRTSLIGQNDTSCGGQLRARVCETIVSDEIVTSERSVK
jgi:hypothetical protein